MANPLFDSYQSNNRLTTNSWITPSEVADPENLPEPLGFTLLIRPYRVMENSNVTSLMISSEHTDFLNHITCIGRVVAIGPCCWNRAEHRMKDGSIKNWVEVGDFVSFPKNVGTKKVFKGVSFITLVDDEIVERLSDPQVFDDQEGFYVLDLPQDHLEKYNTIHKKKG